MYYTFKNTQRMVFHVMDLANGYSEMKFEVQGNLSICIISLIFVGRMSMETRKQLGATWNLRKRASLSHFVNEGYG